MPNTSEQVAALKRQGYNCAQVVAACLLQNRGLETDALMPALKGLGGGLGCGEACGCVLGGAIGMGSLVPEGDGANPKAKALSAALVARFENTFGCLNCRDLKSGKAAGGKPVPCPALMEATVEMCEDILAART